MDEFCSRGQLVFCSATGENKSLMSAMLEHERLFVLSFVVKNKQARLLELLDAENRRDRFAKEVWEPRNLDPQHQLAVERSKPAASDVLAALRKHGAGLECRVISLGSDGEEIELEAALADAVPNCNEVLDFVRRGQTRFLARRDRRPPHFHPQKIVLKMVKQT